MKENWENIFFSKRIITDNYSQKLLTEGACIV